MSGVTLIENNCSKCVRYKAEFMRTITEFVQVVTRNRAGQWSVGVFIGRAKLESQTLEG